MSEHIAFGRPFVVQRDRDISGVSGTGIIADGIEFPDGQAAIHWRGEWALTTPHPDGIESILAIHDHGGRGDLHILWADEQPECGHTIVGAFNRSLGPCIRRPGHSEVFHRDANGAEWRPTRSAPVIPVWLDNSAATFTPRPDGGIAEDGLRRRCEELQARLDDAEEGITAAIRQRKEAEDRAHTAVRNAEAADRVRAQEQRDRDQHAAILREVLAAFDRVASVPEGRTLGYQGKAIDPEQFERWRSVASPTVERPWWEEVAELRADIKRVRAECDAIERETYGQHDEDDDGKREAVGRIRAALDGTEQPTTKTDRGGCCDCPHEMEV